MNIGGIEIGGTNPCRFVAELSNSHNGSLHRAYRIIDAAKAAGCDFLKTQCFTPDELVALRGDGPAPEPRGSQGWSMRELYTQAETPHDWFPKIKAHCERVGIVWFSSVFGLESLALLESLDCPAYKIARLDNRDAGLIFAAGKAAKPIMVSEASLHESGTFPALRLLCSPGYPQVAPFFGRNAFQYFNGFSYHGTNIDPPVVAATLGAKFVEAHIMLWDEPSVLESNVSLTDIQFAEMIRRVREVEAMLA